jgi:hypothetical protein
MHRSGVDPKTGQRIRVFNPRSQAWADHFRWSDDLLTIVGVTPTGRATVNLLQMNRPSALEIRTLLLRIDAHPAQRAT